MTNQSQGHPRRAGWTSRVWSDLGGLEDVASMREWGPRMERGKPLLKKVVVNNT